MASQDLVFRFLGIDAGAGHQFDKMAGKAGFASGALSKLAIGGAAAAAGIAIASVKMASDFQKSMTLLQTQAGASSGEVKKMSSAVLSLAGPTATAPNELAKGLYHIESTGFRGAKALQILKVAAEGAKIGGADLETVTNALNAAVASGIPGVQNMSQAMGALNAVVGSGDMRMQDLADALGTGVLSVVKGFGVSLTDVGAALATFGDNNIRGADAATALRMAVMSLAKPAAGGADAISKLGLQTDTLAKAMQRGGLNAALTLLHDRLKATGNTGNKVGLILTEAFGKKAGIGLQVLEDQFARFQTKVGDVTKGATGFDKAWSATTKTFSFRFDAMRASVEALGIRIGVFLLPIASDLLAGVTALGTAFSATIGFFHQNTVAAGALGAVLAAVLLPRMAAYAAAQATILGEDLAIRFLYAKDAVIKFAGSLSLAKVAALGAYAAAAALVIGLVDGWQRAQATVARYKEAVDNAVDPRNAQTFHDYILNLRSAAEETDAAVNKLLNRHVGFNLFKNMDFYALPGLQKQAEAAQAALDKIPGTVEALTEVLGAVPTNSNMDRTFGDLIAMLKEGDISVADLSSGWQNLLPKIQAYIAVSGGTTDATAKVAAAIEGLQSPVKTAQQAIDDLSTAIKGLVDAPISADEAASKFTADLQALGAAAHGTTRSISLFTKAGRDNRDKIRGLASDVSDLVAKWVDEGNTLPQIRPKLLAHERALERVAVAYTGNKKAADALLRRWHLLPNQIDLVAGALEKSIGKAQTTAKKGGEKAGAALNAGVQAGQLAKHQALDRAVDAMTASIRTGGSKGAAVAKKTGTDVGAGLDAGVIAGIGSQRGAVMTYAFNLGQDAANSTKRGAVVKSPSKITTYVGQMIAQGLITGFDGAAGKVYNHLSTSTRHILDRLARDTQNAKSFQGSLQGSLLGYADISGATGSGVGVKSYLTAKLNDLRRFAHDLARLSRMGLSGALISQIAAAGPDATPIAEQLLHLGRGGIRNINQTERQIQHFANEAAVTVTRDEYGARIHDDLQRLPANIAHAIKKSGALEFTFVDRSGHTVARLRRAG